MTNIRSLIRAILSEAKGWWDEDSDDVSFEIGDLVKISGSYVPLTFSVKITEFDDKNQTYVGQKFLTLRNATVYFRKLPEDVKTQDCPGPYVLDVKRSDGTISMHMDDAIIELIETISEAKGWWEEPVTGDVTFAKDDKVSVSDSGIDIHGLFLRITSDEFRAAIRVYDTDDGYQYVSRWYARDFGERFVTEYTVTKIPEKYSYDPKSMCYGQGPFIVLSLISEEDSGYVHLLNADLEVVP